MDYQTVTARRVTTTTDPLGDSTITVAETPVEGALFEPRQATERTDSRSPGVTTPAKFYLPVPLHLNADDEIIDAAGVTWQVIGGASVWGNDSEVPVERASAV